MAIYTKKGDRGKTSVFDKSSSRISKSSLRINAIGSVDEANSFIGLSASFVKKGEIVKDLRSVQEDLFTIGSILAGAKLRFDQRRIKWLEEKIDAMDKRLSTLTNFILPGGGEAGAHLHTARTQVRRMERELVRYLTAGKVPAGRQLVFLKYVNRLSDYLFMAARYVNMLEERRETIWSTKK